MRTTRKLYYEDSFTCEFKGLVLSCEYDGAYWQIVLDYTAFYPEGGGQPADYGYLSGARVQDVQEKDGVIVHYATSPLPVGVMVEGRVDMDRRVDHMQQHTGEHILSGMLHQMFGANNVGFHIGVETVRMDIDRELTPRQLTEAELCANQIVWQDVPVECSFPTAEELAKTEYRSKKELDGPVRLVTIADADCCACCGTHMHYTGQVGVIKILSAQKYKGGMRLAVVCGWRAWLDHKQRCADTREICAALSAPHDHLPQAVHRMLDENEDLKYQLCRTEDRLFEAMAANVAPGDSPCLLCEDLSPDALRRLCLALCARTQGLCAVFSPAGDEDEDEDENGGRLAYALGCAQGDVRGVCAALNAACNGRGGGKPGLAQGIIQASFEQARRTLLEYKE